MAQQALPAGAVRRRAVFGLFDADGWSWAGIKAAFWFMVLVFLLAYIPNVAYYFTVSDTVKVGYNVLSPINWCPASNDTLPCPAPAGAVVPWQPSPPELALPAAVTGAVVAQSGPHIYVAGGTTDAGVTADVWQTIVGEDGNFLPWAAGPALPEPRTGAAVVSLTGVPYVIGGLDAAGKPTRTVFVGTVDSGTVTGWTLADGSAAGTQDSDPADPTEWRFCRGHERRHLPVRRGHHGRTERHGPELAAERDRRPAVVGPGQRAADARATHRCHGDRAR